MIGHLIDRVAPGLAILMLLGLIAASLPLPAPQPASAPRSLSPSQPYWQVVGMPPEATTWEFRNWLDTLIIHRESEAPLDQPNVFYFSTDGDDSNDGLTEQTPKKSIAAAQAIINGSPDPANLRLRFRRGDVWFTDQGLRLTKQFIVVDSYGTADRKPEFNRFTKSYSGGWFPVSGMPGVYQRWAPEFNPIGWLYDENLGWDRIFFRTSNMNSLLTIPDDCVGSFYHAQEFGFLYVNLGGLDPNVLPLRGLPGNDTIGCALDAHGCRVHDMVFVGFGLDPQETSNQAAGVKCTASGMQATVVSDCESYYCSSHAMHFNSGHQSTREGIATFIRCTAGLCQSNGTPGETIFNSYVYGGGQETIFTECTAAFGTLPDDTWYEPGQREVRGRSCYAHTAIGDTSLMVVDRMMAVDRPFGCASPTRFNNSPTATSLDMVRTYVIGEEFYQSRPGCSLEIGLRFGARVNGVYMATLENHNHRAWTNIRQRGWVANCHFDVDATYMSNGFVALYNSSGNNDLQVENCDFLFRIHSGHRVRFPDYDLNGSTLSRWHNCVFALGGKFRSLTMGRGNPIMENNGYFNTQNDFGVDSNPIMISNPKELRQGFVPVPTTASYQAAALPWFTLEIDRVGNLRTQTPSLGDREHTQ